MGTLYTNTDNATPVSTGIIGPQGPQGYLGPKGLVGNNWAWMVTDPPTPGPGVQPPILNQAGTVLNGTGYGGPGSRWINYTTGEWFQFDGTSWATQGNLLGNKGADNFLKTEVSFNGKSSKGFDVDKINKSILVGHLIFPGTSIAGAINNVQVLLQSSSDSKAFRASVYLVNVGQTSAATDDIVVAQTGFTSLSGKGDDSSWKILSLTVNAPAVPVQQSIFALFVKLRLNREQEIDWIQKLKADYTDEIAGLYSSKLSKLENTSPNSFYNTLDTDYGISPPAETDVKRQERKYIEQLTISKETQAVDKATDTFEKLRKTEWTKDGEKKIALDNKTKKNWWLQAHSDYTATIKVAHLIVS